MKKNNRVVGKVVNGRIIMVTENGGYVKPVSRPVAEQPKVLAPVVEMKPKKKELRKPIPVTDVPEFVKTAIRSRVKKEEEQKEDNDSKIVRVEFEQHNVESLPEMIVDWAIGLGKHAVKPLSRFFDGESIREIFKEETR